MVLFNGLNAYLFRQIDKTTVIWTHFEEDYRNDLVPV